MNSPHPLSLSPSDESTHPRVYLVGAGVVGRAILKAHTDFDVSVWIADQSEAFLGEAVSQLALDRERWSVSEVTHLDGRLPAIALRSHAESVAPPTPVVIESIAERLETKQAFFADAEAMFGDNAVLCSNTSTLRIGTLASSLKRPERFCGMHFFMPVGQRPAVEVIGGGDTSASTIDRCVDHVRRIKKEPLVVGDGPGFIVNRLLSPYLNEAMLLLGRGVSAEQIERAALAYGMPMSPLELIDWIGTRTMFDAGRVYWQSFPERINPSPMLAALIKNKRFGRACGVGLYDYQDGKRSAKLSPVTVEYCERYRRGVVSLGDEEVMRLLAIPMWIEAAIAHRDGVTESRAQFDLAMRGGLGFDPQKSWFDFFESLGSPVIREMIMKWSSLTACMKAPSELLALLDQATPTSAFEQFAA